MNEKLAIKLEYHHLLETLINLMDLIHHHQWLQDYKMRHNSEACPLYK